jgi:hypothetical protein
MRMCVRLPCALLGPLIRVLAPYFLYCCRRTGFTNLSRTQRHALSPSLSPPITHTHTHTTHNTHIPIQQGLAAAIAPGQSLTERCGTPFYMAVEMINKQPYDQVRRPID